MLEDLIKQNKEYNTFAICEWNNKICFVPCDNAMSGIYPNFRKSIALSESMSFVFSHMVGEEKIDAIIIEENPKGNYHFSLAYYTWDGFQYFDEKLKEDY